MPSFLLLVFVALSVGCSSSPKPQAEKSAGPESKRSLAQASYLRLAGIDGALRTLEAYAPGPDQEKDPGKAILGCPLSKRQASAWRDRLRPILVRELEHEREAFTLDRMAYGSQFSTCAASCTCGALADVVAGSEPPDAKNKKERKFVAAALKTLRRKDQAQGPLARRQCARDLASTWLCDAGARAELDGGAARSSGAPSL